MYPSVLKCTHIYTHLEQTLPPNCTVLSYSNVYRESNYLRLPL
jgi:hypothetical protein